MSHKLVRLAQSLKNTPHLLTRDALESYEDYLRGRNNDAEFAVGSLEEARDFYEEVSVENGVSVISIDGGITYRHDFINALCGFQSHQSIYARIESAIEQGAKIVALDIDSPGGSAHGTFEYSKQARKIADENGVKILAYCDSLAASAGYAWASIADEIIVNPMGSVGSIGVVVSIKNDLPKDIKEGSEVIFVYSGDSKVPYDDKGNLRKDFIEGLQEDVDDLYLDFVSHVASFRPMTEEEIMATEAKTFKASKAVDLGLADKIMTGFEFIDYLAQQAEEQGTSNMPLFKRNKDKETLSTPSEASEDINLEDQESSEANLENEGQEEMTDTVTMEELQAQLEEAKAQAAAAAEAQAELTEMKAKAKAAKLDAMTAELSQYSFINEDNAASLASFLMENEGSEIVTALTASLDAAKDAIEASLDVQVGDEGEPQPEDQLAAEKAAQKKAAAARYNK